MGSLSRILVYPVKSLPPVSVERAAFSPGGSLAPDRRYAMFDEDGDYVNGYNDAQVHRLRARYDLDASIVALRVANDETQTTGDGGTRVAGDDGTTADDWANFHLDDDRDELSAWFTDYFGYEVTVRREDELGFPDDTDASGPTLIATGTLERLASWYDGLDATEMRRRLRPNLVVDAPAFWDDRLYADRESTVPFTVGSVRFEGVNPCQRCVVPSRDPDTGEETPGFRETFLDRREATLPEWADRDWFDHFYRVMLNTRVPDPGDDAIAVGDPVEILETEA